MPFGWLNSMAHLRLADTQPRYEPAERRQHVEVSEGRRIRHPIEPRKLVTIGVETVDRPDQSKEQYRDDRQRDLDREHGADRLAELELAEPCGAEEEQGLRREKMRQQLPAELVER